LLRSLSFWLAAASLRTPLLRAPALPDAPTLETNLAFIGSLTLEPSCRAEA